MRGPVVQTLHVLYEVGYFFFATASRAVNATIFKGSMHQTLSARAEVDSRTSHVWAKRKRVINIVFFLQEDHCLKAWESEVSRARKTLERNGR